MTITKNRDGSRLVVKLNGRLDTTTSPQLERTLLLDDIDEVIFDLTDLQYLASAGLRVLLTTQKKMNARKGTMVVKNANEMILEVFEMTGLIDYFAGDRELWRN